MKNQIQVKRNALKISLIYLLIAGSWIILSDWLLLALVSKENIHRFEVYKGLFFVFTTSLILFYLIKGYFSSIREAKVALEDLEYKYSVLFENSPLGIVLCSGSNVLLFNTEASRMFPKMQKVPLKDFINDLDIKDQKIIDYLNSTEEVQQEMFQIEVSEGFSKTQHFRLDICKLQLDKLLNLIFISNITHKIQLIDQLKNYYERLKSASQHIQKYTEGQRKEISRQIHDEVGHSLTLLKMELFNYFKNHNNTEDQKLAQENEIKEYLASIIKSIKEIQTELRPAILDQLGLISAMEWKISDSEGKIGAKFNFNFKIIKEPDSFISITIFRSFQELLHNIVKHSRATEVSIELLEYELGYQLKVEDNGKGFNTRDTQNRSGYGLQGVIEQIEIIGGEIDIKSEKEKYTKILITIPRNYSLNSIK